MNGKKLRNYEVKISLPDRSCSAACSGTRTSDPALRGSYTVEAALLMSVILMLMFLILQVDLFLTDEVRMTALLAEDSTYTQDEESEQVLWLASAKKGFFYLNTAGVQRSAGKNQVAVSYSSSPVTLAFQQEMSADREFTRKVRHPVDFLWTVEAVCGG